MGEIGEGWGKEKNVKFFGEKNCRPLWRAAVQKNYGGVSFLIVGVPNRKGDLQPALNDQLATSRLLGCQLLDCRSNSNLM